MSDDHEISPTIIEWPNRASPGEAGDPSAASAPTPASEPPASPQPEVLQPAERWTAGIPSASSSGGASLLLSAYDRLSDRVLERLRMLREDLDAELSGVRSEVGTLRHAVDDVADRVQLRQVRAALDGLRGDVAGLRSAVLEWPELEQLGDDVRVIRAALTGVTAADRPLPPDIDDGDGLATVESRQELAELAALMREQVRAADQSTAEVRLLRTELVELQALVQAHEAPSLSVLAPLIEEVGAVREELVEVREEMAALRRRIALRAGAKR